MILHKSVHLRNGCCCSCCFDVKCSILNYGQVNHFNYNTGYFAMYIAKTHAHKQNKKGDTEKSTIRTGGMHMQRIG